MAEKIVKICHPKSKSSTITRSIEDDDCDLRVLNVIENTTNSTKKCDYVDVPTIDDVKTEVIILNEAPVCNVTSINSKICENRRIIELGDTISKMELRRQFKMDVAGGEGSGVGPNGYRRNHVIDDEDEDDGHPDIVSRLPPGTVMIKQRNDRTIGTKICGTEDSDYVHESSKESTESNSSGGSSSATLYTPAGKVKRMQHRAVRSKKIVEVRRNPVRNKKKKPMDEDFLRPRQRLMSVKRRAVSFTVDSSTRKRPKTIATPYMNTRSVTRKMYTVGATYQAPTYRDAIEWKEWPSHGMNERPVWHPRFGLTFGYNDRHFISLDGRTYREIVDDPTIEVVSVDPHSQPIVHHGNSNFETINDDKSADFSDKKISFQTCMHDSLHSVLAYCARVVTPTYKNYVDANIAKSTKSIDRSKIVMSGETKKICKNVDRTSSCNDEKICKRMATPRASTSTKISGKTEIPMTIGGSSSSFEVTKCLVVPRRTISFANVRNIQGNVLHEVFGRSSKNTLIFLKPTDPPAKSDKIGTPALSSSTKIGVTKDTSECRPEQSNIVKIDEIGMSDETLVPTSSCKKSLPNVETEIGGKTGKEIGIPISLGAEAKERQTTLGIRSSCSTSLVQDFVKSKNSEIARSARFSNSNQAAEIAKILADYNRKAAKKSLRKNCRDDSTISTNVATTTIDAEKSTKDRDDDTENRDNFFSIGGRSNCTMRNDDIARKTYRGCNGISKREIGTDLVAIRDDDAKIGIAVAKDDVETNDVNDDGRAIDLSTAKSRRSDDRRDRCEKSAESVDRQWLRELIEDTALLYCAATGVRQDDVANYLDTLDSNQSMEWLDS